MFRITRPISNANFGYSDSEYDKTATYQFWNKN